MFANCYKNNMETPLSRALDYLIRTQKTVTQSKIATAIEMSQPYISDLKKGRREGSLDVWEKIAEVFKMSYADFYAFGESLTPNMVSSRLPSIQMTATATHTPAPVIDFQDEATKKHQIVIEGFEDREWALSLNEMLVEIEKRAPELKNIVKGSIENFYKNLPEIAEGKKTGTNPNQ